LDIVDARCNHEVYWLDSFDFKHIDL